MTYPEAIQFLRSLQMFGARLGLENTRSLADAAGKPEQQLRFIHVAGTNGKGSTCAILEAIYRASGLRVGLYTSPHLVSFRERIQINRELISEADVARLAVEAQRWVPGCPEPPTFFEIVTVIAMRYFAEQGCDLVIWETGLGGRLDATNIVTPLASVITNIQFDHEKWLGDTLEKIAREKAGIIKPRVPVITGVQNPGPLAVIREIATAQLAPLHAVTSADAKRVSAALSLDGEHQRMNAAVALRVVEVLQDELPVTPSVLSDALQHVEWAARFQIARRGAQTIVLDGAHNPAGARALANTLQARFGPEPIAFILGVLEDKNWRELCHILAPLARRIVTVPVASPRTASADELAQACREANPAAQVDSARTCAEALNAVQDQALLVLTGSLYFVGEAIEVLGLAPAPGERALNEWARNGNAHDQRA